MHVAIIPDGNRRWAKAKGLQPWNGHERAIENFRSLVDWCREDPRIGTLTVWCFSTENWNRDPAEVSALMRIYEDYLRKERRGFCEQKTRFLHSGRLDRIPRSLANLIREIQEETKDEKEFTLNLAVDYGGKDEILRTIDKCIANQRRNELTKKRSRPITDQAFRASLDHPDLPDIDLVVRTSGEQRTSNFFLWQSVYAEWVFSPKLFPDFTAEDLAEAVREFGIRKRRFGG
jgi:undecaprenyl diphosphate synthase